MTIDEMVNELQTRLGEIAASIFSRNQRRIYVDVPPEHTLAANRIVFEQMHGRLATATGMDTPARIEVLASDESGGSRTLGTLEIPWEDWAVHALPCPVETDGPIHFELRCLTPHVPHHTLHNGDHREMGIHLAAAHLC